MLNNFFCVAHTMNKAINMLLLSVFSLALAHNDANANFTADDMLSLPLSRPPGLRWFVYPLKCQRLHKSGQWLPEEEVEELLDPYKSSTITCPDYPTSFWEPPDAPNAYDERVWHMFVPVGTWFRRKIPGAWTTPDIDAIWMKREKRGLMWHEFPIKHYGIVDGQWLNKDEVNEQRRLEDSKHDAFIKQLAAIFATSISSSSSSA